MNSELGLRVIDLQGNVQFSPIATGDFPAPSLSPDGRWLVFQVAKGNPSTSPLPVDSLFIGDLPVFTCPKLTIGRSNSGLLVDGDRALAEYKLETTDGVGGWHPVDPSESGRLIFAKQFLGSTVNSMSHDRYAQRPTADSLDLHGLTVAEAIERFVEQYNLRVKGGHLGCWTIVHGYGSSGKGGAIRSKLRTFLDQHPDKLRQEAGDNYGNPGWTWVYPKVRLPDRRERIALAILEFCSTPRGDEKILREFAAESGVLVKEVLRSLAKAGRLQSMHQGAKLQYQAAKP